MGDALRTLFGLGLIGLPFLFAAALSLELAKERHDARYGWALFVITIVLLGLNCYWGYSGYQASIAEHKWTAATMSIAAIVPRSVPIVLLCWIAKRRLGRRRDASST